MKAAVIIVKRILAQTTGGGAAAGSDGDVEGEDEVWPALSSGILDLAVFSVSCCCAAHQRPRFLRYIHKSCNECNISNSFQASFFTQNWATVPLIESPVLLSCCQADTLMQVSTSLSGAAAERQQAAERREGENKSGCHEVGVSCYLADF